MVRYKSKKQYKSNKKSRKQYKSKRKTNKQVVYPVATLKQTQKPSAQNPFTRSTQKVDISQKNGVKIFFQDSHF